MAPEVSLHEENMQVPVESENENVHSSGVLLLTLVGGHVLIVIWRRIRRKTVWGGLIIILVYNSSFGEQM
jgi:hypothetical protein